MLEQSRCGHGNIDQISAAIVADDEGVKAVWPRDISADHKLLSLIHAVFNPCACALSRLIQAIFALPDDAFNLLLAHSGKHVNGSDIEFLRDADAGRAQLEN